MTRFIPLQRIERATEDRLREYESKCGPIDRPPVPIERMIDTVYNLRVLWEPISTEGGLHPLAGLQAHERRIIINETRREDFARYPGMLNFCYGHELGHWDLHVDQGSIDHPKLAVVGEATAFRQHRCPSGIVEVLVSRFHREGIEPEDIHEFVRHVTRGMDQPDEAWQVNMYAAALLMPKDLVLRTVSGRNLLEWSTLYRLREAFEVSISALIIRLENLGLLYVADDKSLHRSKLEYFGQRSLF